MAASNREEYLLVVRARDEAKRVLAAIGATGVKVGKQAAEAFRAAGRALKAMGVKGVNAFRKVIAIGRKARAVIKSVTGVFAPLLVALAAVGGAFASTRAASEFASSMAEVATIADVSAGTMERLRKEVLDLAAAHGTAENDVAGGLYQAISAGADASSEAVQVLTESSKLAIAGLADTESTVNAVTSALNAYHKDASEAADITDIFFTAVKKGKTTIPEMAASMADATKKAADLGVEFDEVLGIVATSTLGGTQTAQAFTQVRAVLDALLKKSKEVNALFRDKLGKTFTLQRLRSEGLAAILNDLRAAFGENTDAMTLFLGRAEATSAVLSITGENAGNLVEVMKSMADRAGVTARAFDTQMADPAKRVGLALNAIRLQFLEFGGRAIIGSLNEAIDKVGGVGTVLDQAQVAATAMAGGVKAVTRGLVSAVRAAREFMEELGGVDSVAEIVEAAFEVVAASVELAFERAFDAFQAFVSSLRHLPSLVSTIVAQVSAATEDLPGGQEPLRVRIAKAEERVRRTGGTVSGAGFDFGFGQDPDTEDGRRKIQEAIEAQKELNRLRIEQGARDRSVAEILGKMQADSSRAMKGDSERLRRLTADLVRARETLNDLMRDAEPLPPGFGLPVGSPPGSSPSSPSDPSQTLGALAGPGVIGFFDTLKSKVMEAREQYATFTQASEELSVNIGSDLERQMKAIDLWAKEERERIKLLVDENAILEEQGKVLDDIISKIVKQGKEQAKTNTEFDQGRSSVEDLASSMESSLGRTLQDIFTGAVRGREALRSLVQGFAADFSAQLSRRLAGGIVNSIFPAANGGVFPGGLNFPAYARGGIADRPQLAMVGEGRNKEAVIPMPDNRHVPVKIKGDGGGGLTVNVSIQGGGASSGNARDDAARLLPFIKDGIAVAMQHDRKLQLATRNITRGR